MISRKGLVGLLSWIGIAFIGDFFGIVIISIWDMGWIELFYSVTFGLLVGIIATFFAYIMMDDFCKLVSEREINKTNEEI